MKKVMFLFVLCILSGCSTIQNNLKTPELVNKDNIKLFVAMDSSYDDSAFGRDPKIAYRYILKNIRLGAKEQGFTVVDNIKDSDFILAITKINFVNDFHFILLQGPLIFVGLGLLPVSFNQEFTSTFSLSRTNNVSKIRYEVSKIRYKDRYSLPLPLVTFKKSARINSYSSTLSWQQWSNLYTESSDERNKIKDSFRHAIKATTRIVLNKMSKEYIFDE